MQRTLGLNIPLIVAPMAGGPSSPELVIAACEAGALGSIGAAYLSAQKMIEFTRLVRSKTDKPFAINLFVPSRIAPVSDAKLQLAVSRTQKYRDELKLSAPELAPPYEEDFEAQFKAVLELKPRAFSFVFGLLPAKYLREARKLGILAMGTATSLPEAQALEATGVDAIVVQGIEAGGHRGIFDADADDPLISTIDLLKICKTKIKVPLIAAGGIMNSGDIQKALHAGAELVQMGTAFLATKEAGTSAPYRRKLLASGERATKTTRAFSGRLARGIVNRFMLELDAQPEAILPFPAQNKFTRDLRSASVASDSAEFLSLWAGTGVGPLWTGSTGDLIHSLFEKL